MILMSYEKALRSPADHPKRLALEEAVPRKRGNQRTSWVLRARELAGLLPEGADDRLPLDFFPIAPWEDLGAPRVHSKMPGMAGRDDDKTTKLEACLRRISSTSTDFNSTITIYTDGSATGGTRNGGAAAVVTRGDPANPEVLQTLQQRGRTQTSSYEEEFMAMEMALRWVLKFSNNIDDSILICTDSQCLCNVLEHHDVKCHVLSSIIPQIQSSIMIQWIPGHSDLPS